MTEDDKALVEAMKDAVLHGTGFLKNGKHVPIDDVYIDPRDALIEALSAQLHTVLDREAETHRRHDAKAEALRAENERLREALHEIDIEAANTIPPDGKDAAFAALFRIAQIINPFRLTRAALGETK